MATNHSIEHHLFILPFEKDFNFQPYGAWLRNHLLIPICLGISYIAIVTKGPQLMEGRRPFKLQFLLIVWNTAIAFVTFLAAVRTFPPLIHTVWTKGLHYSVCNDHGFADDPVFTFWSLVSMVVKAMQLFDGAILVLKKKEIHFLHIYKHFTELYAAAFPAFDLPAVGRWVLPIGITVQCVVSTYLALRSMQFKIPAKLPMIVTAAQISQYAIVLWISWHAHQALVYGSPCRITRPIAKMFLAWITTSLVLYSGFFYQKYISKPTAPTSKKD